MAYTVYKNSQESILYRDKGSAGSCFTCTQPYSYLVKEEDILERQFLLR